MESPCGPLLSGRIREQEKQVMRIEREISQQEFYHISGHRNTASYGIQKLMWIRDNEPEVYANTYKVLNAKDYIIFKLTGEFLTDPSDANGFTCFDLKTFRWSDRILDCTGIDKAKLPEIVPSVHVAGRVTKEAAAHTGLRQGTPVVVGGGDGVVANIGCGSTEPGRDVLLYGNLSLDNHHIAETRL